MVWPNFLVIGAAKSGTGSLYHYLAQHPQVFMSSIRETNYFAYQVSEPASYVWGTSIPSDRFRVITESDYLALFAAVTTQLAVGEVSPLYLNSASAPTAIQRRLPEARLIVILRNPIDRAYSGYQMHLRNLRTRLPVAEAFGLDQHWVQAGMYYAALVRYFELFDPAQIKVLLFDELKVAPISLLSNLYRFLGVHEHFVPADLTARHPGGGPRNRTLLALAHGLRSTLHPALAMLPAGARGALRTQVRGVLVRKMPPLPPQVRDQLRHIYKDDVARLSALLRTDLESRWLGGRALDKAAPY
jgi:hypothetical protein